MDLFFIDESNFMENVTEWNEDHWVVTNLLTIGRTRRSGPCNGLFLCNMYVNNVLGDGSGKY